MPPGDRTVTFVPYVRPPATQAQPSRQTRELADLLGRVVQEYEKAHPTVTGAEVRQALQLARRASTKTSSGDPALIAGLVGGLVLLAGLGMFFFMESGGGAGIEGPPWRVAAAVALLGVVAAVMAVLRRR